MKNFKISNFKLSVLLLSILFYISLKLPMYQLLSHLGLFKYFPIVCGAVPAAQLPGSVIAIYPNTSTLLPPDASYVHRPVHIVTVAGHHNRLSAGFLNNEQSNTVVGRMIADNILFLRSDKITTSKTYSSQAMVN